MHGMSCFESLCTVGSGDGANTCSGIVHVSFVALLWCLLALPHVVTGVVAKRGYKEAAHPQREGNAAPTNTDQVTDANFILLSDQRIPLHFHVGSPSSYQSFCPPWK